MSAIVSNTGPLIALSRLDQLNLLGKLFSDVLIPTAVFDEINHGGIRQLGVETFRQADWIRIMPVKAGRNALLESLMDIGEAAVISLALEQGVATVLIDERKARKVARDICGLQVIGTARILVEAKRNGLLPDVSTSFKKLREAGYWIHEEIVQAAMRESGEAKDL